MEALELIEREATSTLDRAQELVVASDEEYAAAGEFILGVKALIATIKADFVEPKRKTDEAHKAVVAQEKRALEKPQMALEIVSGRALDYKREQDRLAREEAERVEADRRRRIEEERLAEAAKLEAEGKTEEADQVIAAPISTPRPTRFISSVPKVDGLSARGNWKGKIINQRLVKREFCLADQSLINAHIQRFWPKGTQFEKKTLTDEQKRMLQDEIGGVEIFLDESFAGSGRQ